MPSAKHSAWHIIGARLEPSSALFSFNSDFFLFRHTAISFLLFVSRAPPPFFFSSDFTKIALLSPAPSLSCTLLLYSGLFKSLYLFDIILHLFVLLLLSVLFPTSVLECELCKSKGYIWRSPRYLLKAHELKLSFHTHTGTKPLNQSEYTVAAARRGWRGNF